MTMNKNQGTPMGNEQELVCLHLVLQNIVASYLHVFDSSTNSSPGPRQRVLSGVERTGPPGGGPARVARHGRAGGGRERGADRATRTRSADSVDGVHDRSCRVSHGGN